MNPSAIGWINKLLLELRQNEELQLLTIDQLYYDLRNSGFIYGSNQSVARNFISNKGLTKTEICKINLIIALFTTYKSHKSTKPFVESLIEFYIEINEHKTSFFKEILTGKKSHSLLEKIIHKRIQFH